MLRILRPIILHLLRSARTDQHHVAELIGKQRVRHLRFKRNRVVVDLGDAGEVAQIGRASARTGPDRIPAPSGRWSGACSTPRHPRVKRTAVVPLHAFAQLEDPALVVLRIDMPGRCQARLDVGRLVGAGQVPQHQRVVEIVSDETIALEPLVRIAGGDRQIAGRHADLQHATCLGAAGAQTDRATNRAASRRTSTNPASS